MSEPIELTSPASTLTPPPSSEHEVARECSRCDGEQHLVGGGQGMGLYRCDTCEMRVGFDVEADPVEFLLDRGLPKNYSQKKGIFGNRLMPAERRDR